MLVESIIWLLIYLVLILGLAWLVLWVLAEMGVPVPPMVAKMIWVIAVLLVLLVLWRTLSPLMGTVPRLR